MARKTVDPRIPTLIRNGLQEKKRSFFVVVGDRPKDAIVNLHFIMSNFDLRQNKSVVWAYKNKLIGFTSHKRKREDKIKKEIKRGVREPNSEDAFELFVSLHDIRYVYYKETEKILGNTYGMCILQDFQAITPNILARTIETVEGGGLVVLLLNGMSSLKQLYTLSMDMHSRYRTEAYDYVVPRFNERFILSLGSCKSCLVIDDELNILPISGGKSVEPLPPPLSSSEPGVGETAAKTASQLELEQVKESVQDTPPLGALVQLARTADQARAVLAFGDAIAEKTLRSTVTLTAGRGRGKSAAMGIAVAAAVAMGYGNIFITSPSPENLKTFFEFVFKGFDALDYRDHADYSIIQSTNPEFQKAVVRVNIHRSQGHRQTIQYIRPQDSHVLGQAELVVVDEAAAIPLPLVRKLLGPYLVFISSTISGYEGTGRSLSLKLIKQLRDQYQFGTGGNEAGGVQVSKSSGKAVKEADALSLSHGGRKLKELSLTEPIRYAQGDMVEAWLNKLLCLDATLPRSKALTQGYPDPSQCELLRVNRDTLFSYHPVSERFLQSMVAMFVASHYKNSPNDLQLMSDAASHELFVLTAPVTEDGRLPEPLCVIQVCFEGKISRQSILHSLSRGQRPSGDLIPWVVSQQFQEDEFATFSGVRVVRISSYPESMGYGSRALQLLIDYYSGKFTDLSEEVDGGSAEQGAAAAAAAAAAAVAAARKADADGQDDIRIRNINELPPLFAKLSERRPEAVDYVGVSYGLTQPLHKFWKRASFVPVYLRQTPNDLTGEHTCVMIRPLREDDGQSWLGAFANDFHRRFMSLLSFQFSHFPSPLALSIAESAVAGARLDPANEPAAATKADLDLVLTPFDHKRLESYANGLVDYHVILDLAPTIANLYFTGRLGPDVHLAGLQQAVLLAIGLQRKDVDAIPADLPSLSSSQVMALFQKVARRLASHFAKVVAGAVAADLPSADAVGVSRANATGVHDDEVVDERFAPLETTLEDDLAEGEDETVRALRAKQKELIDSLPLDEYEVEGDAAAWEDAEKLVRKAAKDGRANPTVSVKQSQKAAAAAAAASSKRKAGAATTTVDQAYDEASGERHRSKAKKSRRDKER